jgi:hypothetical protein
MSWVFFVKRCEKSKIVDKSTKKRMIWSVCYIGGYHVTLNEKF